MLSRYSVLPEQPIINTYVRPDLRYLAAAGQARQEAYDQGLAFNAMEQDKLARFATRDVDIARKNELVNEYSTQAQSIIDQYDGDVGAALPALRQHAAKVAANPFFEHATNALSRQKDYYEANKRISEKGGVALNFNDDAARKPVYNPATGSYNTIDYETQQQLDYTEPKMKLMADIAKDTRLTGLSQASIEGMLQTGKFTGVNGQKVRRVAEQMLLPYLGTDAGRQELRVLSRQGLSDKQIQHRLLSSLVGIGSKQIGQQADMDYMGDQAYLARLHKKLSEEEKPEAPADYGYLPVMKNPNSLPNAEWSADGTAVTSLNKDYGGAAGLAEAYQKNKEEGGLLGTLAGPANALVGTARRFINGGREAPTAMQGEAIKNLELAAKRNNLTPQQLAEKIKDVNHAFVRFTDDKQIKAESEAFYSSGRKSGNFTSRKVYTDETPTGAAAQDILPAFDKKTGRGGITVIGKTMPDNLYTPKGKVIQWETPDGPKTAVIDDSANASQLDIFAWNANQAKYKGTHTFKSRVTTTKDGRPVLGSTEHTYRSTVVFDPETGQPSTELELVK